MPGDLTQAIFPLIEAKDMASVASLLDEHPGLVHSRDADPDRLNRSPLQLAARLGHLDLCRLLVERGAEVYPNPMNQYPPAVEAAWQGHEPVVRYFLDEIPDKADGTQGLGVMINLAGRQGWTDVVQKHLERDPLSVHQRGWIGDSPLHWPAHNNHHDIVKVLIDAGADIEADEVNWLGGKPLHWASEHAPDSVRVLLSAGADVNSRNAKEGSPFYMVTLLIMNATQKDDCAEVTERLLEAGADVDAEDGKGKKASDHAQALGLTRVLSALNAA